MALVAAILLLVGVYMLGMTLVRLKLKRDMEKSWLPPERRQWRPDPPKTTEDNRGENEQR
jgi:hypothetical protein